MYIGFDWSKWGNSGVYVRLILLVYDVALNILPYKLYETWLVEFKHNKLTGLEITGVASGLMIVAVSENGMLERVLGGNVNMPFVCENVVIILLVQEARPEDSRDILQRGLQLLEDKRVRFRGAGDTLMKFGVNQVDEEGIWKENS